MEGQPVLAWQRLQLGLRDVQPLARKLAFEPLRVEGLQVQATRDAAGKINLLQLASTSADNKPSAASAATGRRASSVAGVVSPASAAGAASPEKTAAPWGGLEAQPRGARRADRERLAERAAVPRGAEAARAGRGRCRLDAARAVVAFGALNLETAVDRLPPPATPYER